MEHLLLLLLLPLPSMQSLQVNQAMCAEDCVEKCPEGWEEFGSHCYNLNERKKTWTAADEQCRKEGGHLPSVTSEETNEFLYGKMSEWMLFIGARNIYGKWTWSDCSTWNFTKWRQSYIYNRSNEECGFIYDGSNKALWFKVYLGIHTKKLTGSDFISNI